jgi:hypothetical protein
MDKNPSSNIERWTPSMHLDRAEEWLQLTEEAALAPGNESAWRMTPVSLTLAQTHIALARAKKEIRR